MTLTEATTSLTDVVPAPRPSPLRTAVARRLMSTMARRVPVDIVLPDGSLFGGGRRSTQEGETRPVLELFRPDVLFDRISEQPKIGIGEGYMAGDWREGDDTDLADLLVPFAQRMTSLVPAPVSRLRRIVDRPLPVGTRNTPSGSRRNIEAHYDLSNELFAAFLDETLTYSSALFDDGRPWAEQSLAEAQLRKIDRVLDEANVRAGSRVLEIGTGWGTLAIQAARRGAHVTTVTLSKEQAALAQDRVDAAGLAGSVDIRVQDYREVDGSYDAIASVEMIEAVGEEFWPSYVEVLDQRLAPGGKAVIQAILMEHDRYLATRDSYGWIQKYIFPGGLIPSVPALDEVTTRHTALRITGEHRFGLHYAETLRRWRAEFDAQWAGISELGFDETFRRMWRFYLAYSEAGFASGYLDVAHLRFERPECFLESRQARPARGRDAAST